MNPTPIDDLEQIGRIIQLIKLHRQTSTPQLNRDQFLEYYLSAQDWAFWQNLKQAQPASSIQK